VFILDEFHMLTKEAFNALLKTLEEPPPQVVFVLATTELHKVPETIRSRCQVLLFRRVGETDIETRLRTIAEREGVRIADEVLVEIASTVRGGVRDAETALERALPLAREMGEAFDLAAWRSMTARLGIEGAVDVVASLLQGDARASLHFARDLQQRGTDEREALGEVVETLRWLLLLKVDGADSGLVPVTGRLRQRLQELAASTEIHRLDAMIAAGVRGRERLRWLEDRGVVLEVALVRMAQAGVLPTLADLLAEVRARGMAAAPAAVAPDAVGLAAPAASPVTGPPADGADLRARTIALLKDRQLLQTTVEQCRFEGPDPKGAVVVTLHSERKLHQDRLQSPVVQQELLQVIRAAAGSNVAVAFRTAGAPAVPPATGAAPMAMAAKAEPGPTARRVIEKFRGRVVQVNPEDRPREAPRAAGEESAADAQPAPDPQEPPA
jgi:DNA polymerase III gamma/tau subunit